MLDQIVRQRPMHTRWGMEVMPCGQMPKHIVALGGGTGLSMLLQGLRMEYFPPGGASAQPLDRDHLTAIVTAADDGGSSGTLRQLFKVLPPGDVRNCLLALSDAEPTLQELFSYRFDEKFGGHSLGNLILTALTLLEQDFSRAIDRASELLAVRGRVIPATSDDVKLLAEFMDGSCAVGESKIATSRRRIRRVYLAPAEARAAPRAVSAISGADLIIIGPGSLYTSLIPTLLVRDIARAVAHSQVPVILVMNLMTEPGETDGYSAADMIDAIHGHVPGLHIDGVLLNNGPIPEIFSHCYGAGGPTPVTADADAIRTSGYDVAEVDLLGDGPMIRHEPGKLAKAVLNLSYALEGSL